MFRVKSDPQRILKSLGDSVDKSLLLFVSGFIHKTTQNVFLLHAILLKTNILCGSDLILFLMIWSFSTAS